MESVTLAGLVQIDLPPDLLPEPSLRFCDGAFVRWGGDLFESGDPDFGVIGAVEAVEEGTGDEIPALRMTFLPALTAAAAMLSRPEYQGCTVRSWIAEVDLATNEVIGTPSLEFDGQIDGTDLVIDRGNRELEMDITSRAERLFLINEGNTLSPRFHKSLFPGETGEDNATGVGVGVAWGTALPAQTYGGGFSSGSGGAGGAGGGKLNFRDVIG